MVSCSLISPSYYVSSEEFKIAENNLKKIGFLDIENFSSEEKLFSKWAGKPDERLEKLEKAYSSDSSLIVAGKGGSGVMHFVDSIDKAVIKNKKKLVLGYSDVTALVNFLSFENGMIGLHGPNALKELDDLSFNFLKKALMMEDYNIGFEKSQILNSHVGKIEGQIFGGNLVRFVDLVRSFPGKFDLNDKILFFECNEKNRYELFNLFNLLKLYSSFNPKAILLGGFGFKYDNEFLEMIKFLFPQTPLVFDLPFGHSLPNITIPVGTNCIVDFESFKVDFSFPDSEKNYAIKFN